MMCVCPTLMRYDVFNFDLSIKEFFEAHMKEKLERHGAARVLLGIEGGPYDGEKLPWH
jgi:hypothetical protein